MQGLPAWSWLKELEVTALIIQKPDQFGSPDQGGVDEFTILPLTTP